MIQHTACIIKPERIFYTGAIVARLEQAGFRIAAAGRRTLTRAQVEEFYAVHKDRPFFETILTNMTAGPVHLMELARENAIPFLRLLMGATNPSLAEPYTLRAEFGISVEKNAIHGSDAPETAAVELALIRWWIETTEEIA